MSMKDAIFGTAAPSSHGSATYRDSIQAWLPVKNIIGGVVITKDNRFIKILEVLPVNFYLKSPSDQQNIITSYAAYLKIAPDSMSCEVRTLPPDTSEYVEQMPRNRWAGVDRALSLIVVVLMVAVLFGKGGYSKYGDAYDEPTLPYLRAEELGGDPFDWCYQRDISTPLGGHVYSVGETPHAGMIDGWEQLSTEVDFYAPRISVLAKPLTHELRDYFMGSDAQTLFIDGFDEAYYAEFIKPNTRLPNEPDEVHQFLILRRGGEMLYFRTKAPDSLREHLDEFADIFNQYSELA